MLIALIAINSQLLNTSKVKRQENKGQIPTTQQEVTLATGLRFTENRGQVADINGKPRPDILFTAQSQGVKLFVTATGLHYQFTRLHYKEKTEGKEKGMPRMERNNQPEVDINETYRLDVQLNGSNPRPLVQVMDAGPDTENFFRANCPDGITGVRNYGKIVLMEVYPGIDWVLYTKDGKLEHDFIVRPGAQLSDIQVNYTGAETMKLAKNGSLQINTPLGSITEKAPYSYEEGGSELKSSYVLKGNKLGFDVQNPKPGATLIIDPGVEWATYYGGSAADRAQLVTTDAQGNIYMCGGTSSSNGIALSGHQNNISNKGDAFLVKFNDMGERQWATYYGDIEYDFGSSVSVDAVGNIYLAGSTQSTLGMAAGGHQNTYGGGTRDAYHVKFNTNGLRQWATYYGGNNVDEGTSVANDGSGNVYLTGRTQSTAGIAAGGYQNTGGNTDDAFLVKFNTNGVRQWATYYGGGINESGFAVAADAVGNVYVAGYTSSYTGIAAGGHQNTYGGSADAYLVKFNTDGVRQWATYYGGVESDFANALAIDASGNIYMAGNTYSTANIAIGGYKNTYGGGEDAFLVKFNTNGNRLWGTYYGGSGYDEAFSIAGDVSGNVYLAGHTESTTGISASGHQNTLAGSMDAFVAKFNTHGDRQWGTYYGGAKSDYGYSIATDNSRHVYLAGYSQSTTGIARGGHQNNFAGSSDAYLVKFIGEDTCATTTTWYKDADNDGYSNGTTQVGCFRPVGYKEASELKALSGDCNDDNKAVNQAATEKCDGIDNNCDGQTDEGLLTSWYKDKDNDNFSDDHLYVLRLCARPAGYKKVDELIDTRIDCNDQNAAIYPGATEICDGVDNNCNGQTDEGVLTTWYKDYDNDGYSDGTTQAKCGRPAGYKLSTELSGLNGDCNENNASISPGATEVCDGVDNNCNGQTDDGVLTTWYQDIDNDGYSNGTTKVACNRPSGYKSALELVDTTGDCRDYNLNIHPGATELCGNNIDENCNGQQNEDCAPVWYLDNDKDGYGNSGIRVFQMGQPEGYVANNFDCNDMDSTIYPGAVELPDGKDNNCDWQADEDVNAQTTRYVSVDGTGNGTSWQNASGDLQAMINASSADKGDRILVAAGIYAPNRRGDNPEAISPLDRDNAFILKSGVQILGGFSANGSGRDWVNTPSVLTGSMTTDSISFVQAYHVVVAINTDSLAVLDGFTIKDGKADGTGNLLINGIQVNRGRGGGLNMASSHLHLRNNTLQNNSAKSGGGISMEKSSPRITHTTLHTNSSTTVGGGGLFVVNRSHPKLSDVSIYSNTAPSGNGGGMYIADTSSPELMRVTINSNTANINVNGYGGGIYCGNYSNPLLTNVQISGNQARFGGGFTNAGHCLPVLTNTLITGNYTLWHGGGILNWYASIILTNVTIAGNRCANGFGGGILNEIAATDSVIINNSVIYYNYFGEVFNRFSNGDFTSSAPNMHVRHSMIQARTWNGANGNIDAPYASSTPGFIESGFNLNQKAPFTSGNFSLHPYSVLRDKADTALFNTGRSPDLSHIKTDLAGNKRRWGGLDIGAYEYYNTFSGNDTSICAGSNAQFFAGHPSDTFNITYHWQLDVGNGFENITGDVSKYNMSIYDLQILQPPAEWQGYRYRLAYIRPGNTTYSPIFTLRFGSTWIGYENSDWENPGNWSCDALPNENVDVIISGGTITVSTEVYCRSLTLTNGATITVKPDGHIHVVH